MDKASFVRPYLAKISRHTPAFSPWVEVTTNDVELSFSLWIAAALLRVSIRRHLVAVSLPLSHVGGYGP